MRVLIDRDPFVPQDGSHSWSQRGLWPAAWVSCPGAGSPPFVTAYCLRFSAETQARARIHVTADERYDLYLDGEWIGRGSERGAPDLWFYETYDLELSAGEHTLAARVWSLGDLAAEAQMTVAPGFLLAAEGDWTARLSTGLAGWQALRLEGVEFVTLPAPHWRSARVRIHGQAFPWGYERGSGEGWQPAQSGQPGVGRFMDYVLHRRHVLSPATLPPMTSHRYSGGTVRFVGAAEAGLEVDPRPIRAGECLEDEIAGWQEMLHGQASFQIPPHTARRALVDLENYTVAFPTLQVSGGRGSQVDLAWAEALYEQPEASSHVKGNRDQVEGKYFRGMYDSFLPDGGASRRFEPLWWQAGRYMLITVRTAVEPLVIERLELRETRYPLEMESEFQASDPKLGAVIPLFVRGMQMCANETYFDCPYYEELQYAGDTRLEVLTTYVMTRDERLPRKALRMFDASRLSSGLTQSRYPSRVMQVIPPFSLWWVLMVRDYALWRGDAEFLRQLMPGVRTTLGAFEHWIGADGLLYGPPGWNFMDWVPAWSAEDAGVPPDGHTGASGIINWQLAYALAQAADLEEQIGEPLLAERCRQRAAALAGSALRTFWDDARGLMADDRAHQHFSEHCQCMALLSGLLPAEITGRAAAGLLADTGMERTTIYFSHYLFETYRLLGRVDALLERMPLWFGLIDQGFKTTVESPEPSRSDCHAWGAHPLFHYFATILGIRPAGLGFREVEIRPQLAGLARASGRLVHPAGGEIVAQFEQVAGRLRGMVQLPEGIRGRLVWNDRRWDLTSGENQIEG